MTEAPPLKEPTLQAGTPEPPANLSAAVRALPAAPPADAVDVSIVVPAYNEEKYLPILLRSVRQQRTDLSIEVIVIDDGSTDRTAAVASEFGALVLPNPDKLDVVQMRNLGFLHSRGRAVLFTDADTMLSPHFVERLAGPILRDNSPYDMTQSMWYVPLERVVRIAPDGPCSRSYLLWLRYAPAVLVGRMPVRGLRWIARWVAGGFRTPLMEIGDRVRTGMMITRRELVIAVGGWRGAFGARADTVFSFDCLEAARKTRWVRGATFYGSERRGMPTAGIGWMFRPLWRHLKRVARFRKWISGGYRREERERAAIASIGAGYANPHGRR